MVRIGQVVAAVKNTTKTMSPKTADASFACKHVGFLKKLKRCNKTNRAHLLTECDRGQINAVCECIQNVLHGTVKPTSQQKKRLRKHVDTLANLADANIDWSKKQKYLKTQQGGALVGTVLGVVLPALIELLTRSKAAK